jgi:hypothetical protein
MSFYGYCPKCGAIGVERERRPDGNDVCENGHTYKSKDAVQKKSVDHDIMLHGVLRMPTDMWSNDPLDMYQRHARYIQASDRIIELENKLASMASVAVIRDNERLMKDLVEIEMKVK